MTEYWGLTDEERAAFSAQTAANHRRKEEISRPGAIRAHTAWTEEDRQILLDPWLTNLDRALKMQRLYQETCKARQRLLHELGEPVRTYRKDGPERKQYVVACACATIDKLHETWCPVYVQPGHTTTP